MMDGGAFCANAHQFDNMHHSLKLSTCELEIHIFSVELVEAFDTTRAKGATATVELGVVALV
jgi:hypothetical protein